MKKTEITTLASLGVAAMLLPGCIEDQNRTNERTTGVAVSFSTTIHATRAHGNLWEGGDHIGVYMVPSDTDDWGDVDEGMLFKNMKYGTGLAVNETDDSPVFAGVDEDNTLVWPTNGSTVDFVAYYPYLANGIENFVYPIDVSRQDPQKGIDLMWSNNVRRQSLSSESPVLAFRHMLTKLVFNVRDLGGTTLEGMTATIAGLASTAGFNLRTGAISGAAGTETFEAVIVSAVNSDGNVEGAKDQVVVEAIVLPGAGQTYGLTFGLASGETALFERTNDTYVAGKRYIFNISLSAGRENVGFSAANGELKSITDWIEQEDETPHEIPKTGNTGGVAKGATSQHTLKEPITGFVVAGNGSYDDSGYTINNSQATITMTGYSGGVETVTVRAKKTGMGTAKIASVKVGNTVFEYGAEGSSSGNTEATIETEEKNYVFGTPDQALHTGTIEIIVSGGKPTVIGFTVN